MGFFSVAARGAIVRSRGHRVSLEPAVFRGEAEACVLEDATAPGSGTEITFPLGPNDVTHGRRVADETARAARHLPLDVTFDGAPVERRDFLAQAQAVAEWAGVRIGVMRNADGWSGWPHDLDAPHRGYNPVNFMGVVAGFHDAADRIAVAEEDGTRWSARLDVVDAPDLRLVLPTREAVIVDAFARALLGRARHAVYAHIASKPSHTLSFGQARDARAMGIDMPDATIRLARWSRHDGDDGFEPTVTLTGDDPALAVAGPHAGEIASANLCLLDAAGSGETSVSRAKHASPCPMPSAPVLVRGKAAWAGYPAYDRLVRVGGIDAVVTLPDGPQVPVPADGSVGEEETKEALEKIARACGGDDPATIVAPGVALAATLHGPPDEAGRARPSRIWQAATKLAFTLEAYGDAMEETGFVAGAGAEVPEVAHALVDHFFAPSDDRDAGPDEEQERRATESAYERARAALLPPGEAKLRTLLDELDIVPWNLRRGGLERLTVTRLDGPGGRCAFRIEAIATDGTRVVTDTQEWTPPTTTPPPDEATGRGPA